MSYVFGIDLGTTYSCIAYMDAYDKPVVLKNSEGENTTPSVVLVESEDNIIVGNEAKRSIELEPDKTVQFIKRKIGKEHDRVTLNGREYSAPEVSAYILKKLVADANAELKQTGVIRDGGEIRDVVITCPAYFGMNEREATKTAGELAGLNVLNIINEPTAAAISYGVSVANKSETVLVYDLGGGTFDITVMDIEGGNITVVCTGGDDQLGGKDWDECLMEYVMARYEEEYGEDLSEDPETVASLYVEVESWKKSLTAREKVNLSVNGPAGRFREELTREKFGELTESLLSRTKNLMDDVLAEAAKKGYPKEKISKILLVGGSSHMPQVSAMLTSDYGIPTEMADPNLAVAKGAAIFAKNEKAYNDFAEAQAARTGKTLEEVKEENLLTGELDKMYLANSATSGDTHIRIKNVLSRTYGIEVLTERDEARIVNMLKINDTLPASKTETFYTHSNGQIGADILLYESRSSEDIIDIEGRTPLTEIHMTFTKSVPQGTAIDMIMTLDNSGILHIVAEEQEYHSRLDTTFELSNQMTDEEKHSAAIRMSAAQVE